MAEEQIVSIHSGIVEAFKLIISGGIGAVIAGGILTYIEKLVIDRKLETQRANYNKQLEALKSQLERRKTIHKLQFEKEFELYDKFWKALIDVKKTASVTPLIDIMPKGSEPGDVYKERWTEAAKALNDALDTLHYNLPFYHNDVSNPAVGLLSECRKRLNKLKIILQQDYEGSLDIYEEDEKISKMINEVVDKIENTIKERIGLLQEANLIE